MRNDVWSILIKSIFEYGKEAITILPGQDLDEWLGLVESDYDSLDRDLISVETEGGG